LNILFNIFEDLLNYIFFITKDWGISIVLLTVFIRILLVPFSIKQKKIIHEKQKIYDKIQKLNIKYKDNPETLKKEMNKYENEKPKSNKVFLVFLLQLPILISLYMSVMNMPMQVGTILVPWIKSIKMSDNHLVIPIIYSSLSIILLLIPTFNYFDTSNYSKISKSNLITTLIVTLMITINAPIAIGIYFITTTLFSLIEELIYKLYISNKTLIEQDFTN
jgi:YidC/Oxa1 family membrane protein insertase